LIVFLVPDNDAIFQQGVLLRSRVASINEPIIERQRHFDNHSHGPKVIIRFLSVNPGKRWQRGNVHALSAIGAASAQSTAFSRLRETQHGTARGYNPAEDTGLDRLSRFSKRVIIQAEMD
jgi:hypothetical protein